MRSAIGNRQCLVPCTDVRHVIEYRNELVAGALYRVMSGIGRVGRTSLVTVHRMFALQTGDLAAECEMTSVYFDLSARTSSPLPQSLRDGAMALLSTAARILMVRTARTRWVNHYYDGAKSR